MTDQNKTSSAFQTLATTGGTAVNRSVPIVRAAVLAVSVAAAIPTAQNLYYAWKNGVPFNQVQHRLSQAALFERNYDCKIDYRALSTGSSSKVEVGSCAKTNDISIRLSGPKGQTNYEWISYEQLPKPETMQAASLMDLFISQAVAEELIKPQSTASGDARTIVIADASETMCQVKGKDTVVRVVKENGKCVRETVSLFKGSVEKREEIACDKACPIPN